MNGGRWWKKINDAYTYIIMKIEIIIFKTHTEWSSEQINDRNIVPVLTHCIAKDA